MAKQVTFLESPQMAAMEGAALIADGGPNGAGFVSLGRSWERPKVCVGRLGRRCRRLSPPKSGDEAHRVVITTQYQIGR